MTIRYLNRTKPLHKHEFIRVKLNRNMSFQGNPHVKGDVIELDSYDAYDLIVGGRVQNLDNWKLPDHPMMG